MSAVPADKRGGRALMQSTQCPSGDQACGANSSYPCKALLMRRRRSPSLARCRPQATGRRPQAAGCTLRAA
eukprot:6237130-Alexandrium_andersonii.AAC.1